MSKFFQLKEFVASNTAKQMGIDNTPSFEVVDHLQELVSTILDPLRKDWGSPIKVTSGYRCPALNKAVGGSSNSSHKIGYAADIQPANGELDKFINFCKSWFKSHKDILSWDQVILEKSVYTQWVHIGLKDCRGRQRKQIFNMVV